MGNACCRLVRPKQGDKHSYRHLVIRVGRSTDAEATQFNLETNNVHVEITDTNWKQVRHYRERSISAHMGLQTLQWLFRGKSIEAETDHKRLVTLLSQHTLDQIRPRIQRFRMRLMCFHTTTLTHVPSKEHYTPDALSRMQSDNHRR